MCAVSCYWQGYPPQPFVIWKLVLEWQPFRNRCYTDQPESPYPVAMPDVPPVPTISCYQWTPDSWNGPQLWTLSLREEITIWVWFLKLWLLILSGHFSKTVSIHLQRQEVFELSHLLLPWPDCRTFNSYLHLSSASCFHSVRESYNENNICDLT